MPLTKLTRFAPHVVSRVNLAAFAVVAVLFVAPAVPAAIIGYDIVFTCQIGCDPSEETTGMISFDDSILLVDGQYNPFTTPSLTWMITTVDGTIVIETDHTSGPLFLWVIAGAPAYLEYDAAEGLRMTDAAYFEYTAMAIGTYEFTRKASANPVPEPGAALLFAVGLPLVARRIKGRATN